MQLVKSATSLIAIASLLSFAGCASHTHARHGTHPQRNFTTDKDGRHFNSITRNFDPAPPFGPRSNGSPH